MAQNAKVAALTDELIQSIIGFDPETERKAYKHAKDIATRGLRAHQYNRTNQFEVHASFDGLDEKFRVLDRDDLADALQSRVKELRGHRNKWIPEYLSLLLLLSDRPTENSQVEALDLLRPPTPPSPLTWAQILEDNPYSDEEIWKDIDYAAESSEDERTPKRKDKKSKSTPPSSIDEDDTFNAESYVILTKSDTLSEIEGVQFWKSQADQETGKIEITELQAVRETLFMLAGLHTSLFLTDKQHSNIRVNQKYIFSHAIMKTIDHLLSQLADIGRDLYRLRRWAKRSSSLPLIQTFEAMIRVRLACYDQHLAELQRNYLVPKTPIAVSLLELHDDIRQISRPLLRLAHLVADIEPQLLINPFIHLETLFEQISLAQMTLELDVFEYFSRIFFECLQTYLKPIRRWMESGELGANDETFFVFENDSGSEVSSLWHDRFVLRRGKEDALRSPEFLQPAAMKIFNTGKSVVFLKELGVYGTGLNSSELEPGLDYETVCGTSGIPLSPFPELFQSAFEMWIRSKYSLASTILRNHLFIQSGLLKALSNFGILFLSTNGSIFQDFSDAVFERMDAQQRGWNDRFLLTELARGIYGTIFEKSDIEKIVVRSIRMKNQGRSVKGLGTLSIDYAIPWPIMNIIQRSSMPIYQQTFTFLLQSYRAKYLLQNVQLHTIQQLKDSKLRQLSFKLRARLIWFADILRSYLAETVIALSTEEMTIAMTKAEDIDAMSTIHIKYLARLQEQSLLAENLKPIHRAVISLLDLGVLFHDTLPQMAETKQDPKLENQRPPKSPTKALSKGTRRKSVIPAIVEDESSDSTIEAEQVEDPAEKEKKDGDGLAGDLRKIDQEFSRLLPFLTAGLRNIGRVGAEPVWEMLAERLEWDKRKDR